MLFVFSSEANREQSMPPAFVVPLSSFLPEFVASSAVVGSPVWLPADVAGQRAVAFLAWFAVAPPAV